ncbi:MAG: hypothetical protein GC171_00650 [Terrimonas sp.]|nr:hypothetical protein [Terrimonas sp.]
MPCSAPEYRQFDFWIGEWDVYSNANGNLAGKSKISLLLDSCVILEEWTSANLTQGIVYTGKSFNKYNPSTKQWQQTWVDNVGGSTEFLRGEAGKDKMTFYADHVKDKKGNDFFRRLTFYKLGADIVRQHGEKSTDNGKTWQTEYDLEYRRKH